MSLLIHRTLKIYSTQLDVWLTVAGYGEGTSIPKAKSVNQSFHTTAECAFLYAGLNTYLALQVNVTENDRILRDVFQAEIEQTSEKAGERRTTNWVSKKLWGGGEQEEGGGG